MAGPALSCSMRRPHLALAGDGLLAGPAITPPSVTPLANNMRKSQGFFSWARHQDLWKNAPAPIMMIGYQPGLYSAAVKRSEESREGKECVSTGRSRGAPYL